MRIWFQSGTGVGIDGKFTPYQESITKHAKKVSRPDTICEFHGPGKTYPFNRSRALHNPVIREYMKNAMFAEAQGFDAIMTNTIDSGITEIREVVAIPVVGMGEATLSFSCQLAANFAFITWAHKAYEKGQLPWLVELAERYGFKERMVEGGCLGHNFTNLLELWGNPAPYIEEFNRLAENIVSRGADLIIPTPLPLSQWLIDQNIKQIKGATIVDPLAIGIKTAELMVDLQKLGIKRPKIGTYAPAPVEIRTALSKELGGGL